MIDVQAAIRCIVFLVIIGVVSFVLGRILPKQWFHYDRFPFKSYSWEKDGKIYEAIRIRRWQAKVPDMSRLFKKLMPIKRMDADYKSKLPTMVQETCVAELIHAFLAVAGLGCVFVLPGFLGWLAFLINFGANMIFVIIQRYNRPILVNLMERIRGRAVCDDTAECSSDMAG